MYTLGDMFGNSGGFSLAFWWAGFQPEWYLDNNEYAAAIHRRHFPICHHFGDIFDYDTLPYVDVITAGFPCQPFSYAGKQRGKDDPRYLVPKMMDLLMEVRPCAILFENTPGFPTLNDGAEFRGLLRTLARNGYDAEWDHLRASDFGAPHIRKRWFCVAYTTSPGLQARHKPGLTAYEAQARTRLEFESERCCEMADSNRPRLAKWESITSNTCSQQSPVKRNGRESRRGATESRLGRNFDGLSDWLDALRWPAPQGLAQYDWEPPRTTTDTAYRAARVERLGLAIVPQVVYPIALAIREWLEEQDVRHSQNTEIALLAELGGEGVA